MDWDKIIDTVAEFGRKAFTLALCTILLLVSVCSVYVAILAVCWLVRHTTKALGS